jgi:hypothetical protein
MDRFELFHKRFEVLQLGLKPFLYLDEYLTLLIQPIYLHHHRLTLKL